MFPLLWYIGITYSLTFGIIGILSIIVTTYLLLHTAYYVKKIIQKHIFFLPVLIITSEIIFVFMRVIQFYFYGLFITQGSIMPFYCPFILFTEIPVLIIPLHSISWPLYLLLFNTFMSSCMHYLGIIRTIFFIIFPLFIIDSLIEKNTLYFFNCIVTKNINDHDKIKNIKKKCHKSKKKYLIFPECYLTINDFKIMKKIKKYSDLYDKIIIVGCYLCRYNSTSNKIFFDNGMLIISPNQNIIFQKKCHAIRFFETKNWLSHYYKKEEICHSYYLICSEFFFGNHFTNKVSRQENDNCLVVLASWCWINKKYLYQYKNFMHRIAKFNSILLNKKIIISYGI